MVILILVQVLNNFHALIDISVLQQAGQCTIYNIALRKLITMIHIYEGHIHNVLLNPGRFQGLALYLSGIL